MGADRGIGADVDTGTDAGPRPAPVYECFYDSVLVALCRMGFPRQLDELRGASIVVLDYTGMAAKHVRALRRVGARIVIMDDNYEAVEPLLSGSDIVYVFSMKWQHIPVRARHIRVVFEYFRITGISYRG